MHRYKSDNRFADIPKCWAWMMKVRWAFFIKNLSFIENFLKFTWVHLIWILLSSQEVLVQYCIFTLKHWARILETMLPFTKCYVAPVQSCAAYIIVHFYLYIYVLHVAFLRAFKCNLHQLSYKARPFLKISIPQSWHIFINGNKVLWLLEFYIWQEDTHVLQK